MTALLRWLGLRPPSTLLDLPLSDRIFIVSMTRANPR
jgi:hypothetical protein